MGLIIGLIKIAWNFIVLILIACKTVVLLPIALVKTIIHKLG